MRRFTSKVIDQIAATKYMPIRAGGKHRFIPVWVVVVEGRHADRLQAIVLVVPPTIDAAGVQQLAQHVFAFEVANNRCPRAR